MLAFQKAEVQIKWNKNRVLVTKFQKENKYYFTKNIYVCTRNGNFFFIFAFT